MKKAGQNLNVVVVILLCYLAVTEKMYFTLERKNIHDTYNQMHEKTRRNLDACTIHLCEIDLIV